MFCQDTVSTPYAEQAAFADGGRAGKGPAWLRGPVRGSRVHQVQGRGWGEQKPAAIFVPGFGDFRIPSGLVFLLFAFSSLCRCPGRSPQAVRSRTLGAGEQRACVSPGRVISGVARSEAEGGSRGDGFLAFRVLMGGAHELSTLEDRLAQDKGVGGKGLCGWN